MSTPPAIAIPDDSAADLVVAVEISAAEVRPGDRLRIVVHVRNRAGHPRAVATTTGCLTDYEIVDSTGTVVAESGQMCTEALASHVIPARGTIDDAHNWIIGLRGMPSVPPGAYGLRGVLLARSGRVQSPTVPIRILPS